jgi:hypothetical protein
MYEDIEEVVAIANESLDLFIRALPDNIRSEVALKLSEHDDWSVLWPVGVWLVSSPYPTDHTAWINLLEVADKLLLSICWKGNNDKASRFTRYAVSLLIKQGLRENTLVQFETLRLLGAMNPGDLWFQNKQEKIETKDLAESALNSIQNADLREEMKKEVLVTFEKAKVQRLPPTKY